MTTNTLIKLMGLSLLLCACKKDLEPQESSDSVTPAVAQSAETNAMPAEAIPTNATTAAPAMQAQPTQMPVQQPTTTAPGMNPPHGQPNHRCDIAVGAPLSSPQKMSAQPAMTINPSTGSTTQPQVINTKQVQTPPSTSGAPAILSPNAAPAAAVAPTAPGMNPPHGQPGHKCEVAVGAPLPK